jgi:hypothetical protein
MLKVEYHPQSGGSSRKRWFHTGIPRGPIEVKAMTITHHTVHSKHSYDGHASVMAGVVSIPGVAKQKSINYNNGSSNSNNLIFNGDNMSNGVDESKSNGSSHIIEAVAVALSSSSTALSISSYSIGRLPFFINIIIDTQLISSHHYPSIDPFQ